MGDPLTTAEARELAQRWAPVRPSQPEMKRLVGWAKSRLACDLKDAAASGRDLDESSALAIDALRDDLGISMADARGLATLAGSP